MSYSYPSFCFVGMKLHDLIKMCDPDLTKEQINEQIKNLEKQIINIPKWIGILNDNWILPLSK